MKLRSALAVTMVLALAIPACGEDASGSEADDGISPDALAAAEEYVRALNEQDAEGFLAIVNVPVYEYVFSDTSFEAEGVASGVAAGDLVVETGDEVSVQLIHTVTNTAYVAIVAVRPNTEPTPVNGIMVLELSEFSDRGWLVTRDYRHGL